MASPWKHNRPKQWIIATFPRFSVSVEKLEFREKSSSLFARTATAEHPLMAG
jgi:hypothetical protein